MLDELKQILGKEYEINGLTGAILELSQFIDNFIYDIQKEKVDVYWTEPLKVDTSKKDL